MKEKKILSALQHIDPELIEEAMSPPTVAKRNLRPMFRGLVAACIGIVFVALLMRGLSNIGMGSEEPEEPDYTTGVPTEECVQSEVPGEMATEDESSGDLRVMLFTSYGFIDDEGYKQTVFETVLQWCETDGVEYSYEQPREDSVSGRIAVIEMAVQQGYNVMVLPGADFADAIVELAELYPDIYFVALGVKEDDLQQVTGIPYVCPPNVYCVE